LRSCIGMLGVSTWFVAVMYRYVRSVDLVCCRDVSYVRGIELVCCGHVLVCLEYRPGLLRSCIGMLGVSNWFVAVMYQYARSIDQVSKQSCIGMLGVST
jgi:hypothetical protein